MSTEAPTGTGEAVDPERRDEVPGCWCGHARGSTERTVFGPGVRPWNWLELGPDDAERLWSALMGFVAYFNARYGERPDRRVPPCWAEHGPLVEELTTLLFARWQAFESPHASVGGAEYFHAYTLPAFYRRMHEWLGDDLLSCQQGRHRDRDDPPLACELAWECRTEDVKSSDVRQRQYAAGSAAAPAGEGRIEIAFLEDPTRSNRTADNQREQS